MESNLSGGGVQESKPSSVQPCLLITDRENCRIQTNILNNKPQLLYDVGGEIPEFLGRKVACSFGEWVLLTVTCAGDYLPEVLVNLLSKETIELPSSDFKYDFCTLTSHPYDPTCHIVYFNQKEDAFIFCQPGDKEFTIKKWDYYEPFPTGGRAVVAGKLLVITSNPISYYSVLGVIEFEESTCRFDMVEMDFNIENRPTKCVYCECSGELFVIYRTNCGMYLMGFEIFKADLLNKKWVSVKNLGTLAIFIGYGLDGRYGLYGRYGPCASVESGIKANSIYFLERDDLDNYYIYNLGEGTIRKKPIFSSSMETRGTALSWVMMPCEASFFKLLKGDQESICHDSENDNKTSGEVEEVGVQNSWNMVPPELLNLIQLHLFGRDNAVFRVVCKAWQQVSIQDYSIPSIPLLLSSTTLLEQCRSSSPLLMFQEDLTISCDTVPIFRFFDPVHKKLYRMGMPQLRGTDIQCSKDGWLLVCRYSDQSIFFFNPLTQEKIELPPLESYFYAEPYSLSFSALPTSSNCLVAGVVHCLMFYTLKHGEETWREHEMREFQGEYARCPVVLNGLHHFMRANRDMVVFNLKDDVEDQFPYCQTWSTKFEQLEYLHLDDFFLELDGALALVSVAPDGGQISIFKWNDLETGWELMEGGVDFGGKEMFLSRRGSFMEKIDDGGGMGNSIFLPMIDDAKEGVFYSLATRRYHTLYSGYSSELPYDVDTFLNGIWIKPDRKIVGDSNLNWFI